MIVQIFGEGTGSTENVSKNKKIRDLIKKLRAEYLAEGNPLEEFPNYLACNGIRVSGPLIVIDDKWDTYFNLTAQY